MKSRFLWALVALLYTVGSPADTLPEPFEADYEGSRFPLTAKAKLTLARVGDYYRYTLRSSISAAFYRWTEVYDCSVLRISDGRFYPLEYVHRDKRRSRRNRHVRFDWPRNTAHTTTGDGKTQQTNGLEPPVWDVMSVQVRMRADAATARPGAAFDYTLLRRGSLRRYPVKVEGVETVETGNYALRAVKMSARSGQRESILWFAPDYAWLPVRISLDDVSLELVSPPGDAPRDAAPATGQPPRC